MVPDFCCFDKKNAVLTVAHYLLNYFLCLLQLGNVRNKYDADEQAAVQHYEVRTGLT